jgi:hypothetical protein
MAIGLLFIILAISAPFIFFPSGGFSLANKALSFAAVISFTLTYSIYSFWAGRGKAFSIFLCGLFSVSLYGSFLQTRSGHEVILKQSDLHEKASKEILNHTDEKILVISDNSYYFSNLADIYKEMLMEEFPEIKAASTVKILPLLESYDFDRIIVAEGLCLDPSATSKSKVTVLDGEKAKGFLAGKKKEIGGEFLQAPRVTFIPTDSYLRIHIVDQRKGTYMRCLYRDTYIGCYPIPEIYVFKFNSVKKFEKIDIIYLSDKGKMSSPATFRNFQTK